MNPRSWAPLRGGRQRPLVRRPAGSAMDYLFGIVVLLCGVVQAGRGAKPKHNVPRLKLSYKGKTPPLEPPPDSGIYGAAVVRSKQPVQPVSAYGCSSRSPFRALFLVWSVFFFFPLSYFCESIPARVSYSLLHLGQ